MSKSLKNIYEPEDDSRLLLDSCINELDIILNFKGNCNDNLKDFKVCEVGVGSGYIISNLYKKYNILNQDEKEVKVNFFGSDINEYAIDYVNSLGLGIDLRLSSLLSGFDKSQEKFDMILFNTPYLPLEDGDVFEDLSIKDKAIYGGKKGYEVIIDFIDQINDKLKNRGCVMMLFSSLSDYDYIVNYLDKNLFKFEIVVTKDLFFEKLYVLKIIKSDVLKKISSVDGLKNVIYLTSGKHSKVFEAQRGIGNVKQSQDVIIKVGDVKDLQIEGIFLEKLQKYRFVPEVYFKDDNFIVMEKLKGIQIKQFLDESNKEKIMNVLDKILEICQQLDSLGINKFEMTNPYKHIFVDENLNVKFIDFERSIYSDNPKNTRQFLQYIRRNIPLLKSKGVFVSQDRLNQVGKQLKDNKVKNKVNIKNLSVGCNVDDKIDLEIEKEIVKELKKKKYVNFDDIKW